MPAKDSELLNSVKALNSSIESLEDAIDSFSSKFGTPEGLEDSITPNAAMLEMRYIGMTAAIAPTDGASLARDEDYFYTLNAANEIVKFNPGETTNEAVTDAASDDCEAIVAIDNANYSFAAAQGGYGVGSRAVYLFDLNGNLIKTLAASETGQPATRTYKIGAMAYDSTNDIVYVVYEIYEVAWGSYTKYGELNLITGIISSPIEVENQLVYIDGAAYSNETKRLYITFSGAAGDMDYDWFAFDTEAAIKTMSGMYPSEINDLAWTEFYFCFDSDNNTFYLWDGSADVLHQVGLTFVQSVFIEGIRNDTVLSIDDNASKISIDDGAGDISIDDGGNTITVDGTVTTIATKSTSINHDAVSIGAAAAQILAANANRESVEIFNADTVNILYVGDDATVTTANGRPVYPLCSVAFDGYTGAIFGIASGVATDVRYTEIA